MKHMLPFVQYAVPTERQRGFSKFEFALASAVFAVVVGIAANQLNVYQERFASVAAEQLIVSLRTALTLKFHN